MDENVIANIDNETSIPSAVTAPMSTETISDTFAGHVGAYQPFSTNEVDAQPSPRSAISAAKGSLTSFSAPTGNTQETPAQTGFHTSPLESLHLAPSPQQLSPWVESHVLESSEAIKYPEPLDDVREACLLRYYIEELSHWVSQLLSPSIAIMH